MRKKSCFFSCPGWTITQTAIILYALFVQGKVLHGDNQSAFFREGGLSSVSEPPGEMPAFIERGPSSHADEKAADDSETGNTVARDVAIRDLARLNTMSGEFAARVIALCRLVRGTLHGSGTPDPLAYVRLRINAEDVEKQATDLYFFTVKGRDAQKTQFRILDVNPKLGVAVISGGIDRKVRNGLLWVVKTDGRKSVVLKTVAVRPFVSAAVIKEGELTDLVPGMTVIPGRAGSAQD
jgi:hypothetical protein